MINSSFSAATEEENEQIDEMTAIVKSYDSGGMITGEGPLTKDLTTIADKDFIVTSILSTLAIFIIVAICFKSLTIPIVVVGSIELAIFINEAIPFFDRHRHPLHCTYRDQLCAAGCNGGLCHPVDHSLPGGTATRARPHECHAHCSQCRRPLHYVERAGFVFCATFGVYLTCNIEMIKSICSMLARGSVISAIVIFFFLTPLLLVCERIISKTSLSWSGTKPNGRSKKANGRPSPVDSSGGNQSESKKSEVILHMAASHERSGDSHENKASDTKINLCRARTLHPPDERMQRAGAAGGKHKRHDAAPCHRAARSTNVCPLYWKNPQI